MKLYKTLHLALLCLLFSTQVCVAQILDQKVRITIENITLEEAFKIIKKNYGVNFSYSPDQVNVSTKVSLNVRDISLQEAL